MHARIDTFTVRKSRPTRAVRTTRNDSSPGASRSRGSKVVSLVIAFSGTCARGFLLAPFLCVPALADRLQPDRKAAPPNQPPTVQIVEPAEGSGLIAPATFTLRATGADADGTVTRLTFALNGSALGIANGSSAGLPIRNLFTGNYRFTITATDDQGATGSTNLDLVVKTPPTVTFRLPGAHARLTASDNLIYGTASDSRGIARVDYSINDGPFQPAAGTTHWSFPVAFGPGTNVVRARSLDFYGNSSPTNARTFFQVVPSPITLAVTGSGAILRLTNSQILDVHRGYRVSARAGDGYVFSHWSGSMSSLQPDLDFLMQPDFALTANFVPNPFPPASGTYHGLILETPEPRPESSGDFVLQVTSAGRYSAAFRLAGRRLRASGALRPDGTASNLVSRPGLAPIAITWAVNLDGLGQVVGRVGDGLWQADLDGDRAMFHAATNRTSLAGRYTLAIQPSPAPDAPPGDGWATLTVAAHGVVAASGQLPDGTRFMRSVPVGPDGEWPVYVPLYQNLGVLVGWVRFDPDGALDDLGGSVEWIRPATSGTSRPASLYPAGFTNTTGVTGSRYVPPSGPTGRILNLTQAEVVLVGNDLSQAWTNPVALGPRNVTNAGPNRLALSLSAGTGQFKGVFTDPILNRPFTFTGAVRQKSTNATGYFLGPTSSGRVQVQVRRE